MANIQQISSQIVNPPRIPGADEIPYMCRICSNCDVSINAFSELGRLLKLEEKVRTCFKLELSETGPLPNNVCMNCLGKLNICYEVSLQVTATQEKIATALSRAGIPVFQQPVSNGTNSGTSSPGKYTPKIESVQSLTNMPNSFMLQQSNNVPTNVPMEVPKPVPPSQGVKRSSSPETPSKKERKTVCSTCGEWFFKSELPAHTKQVHQSVKLVYGCVNCSANFNTQEELTKHSETCS